MPSGLQKIFTAFACGGKRRKGDKDDKTDKTDERNLSEKTAAAAAAASASTLAVDALHAELDEARGQIAQWRGKALALEQEIASLQSAAEAHARREEEVAAELAALQATNGELASRRASACMKGEDQQRALDAEVLRAEQERERLQREMDEHRRTREALDAARRQMEEAGRELAQLRTKQQAMETLIARRSAEKRASAVTQESIEGAEPTPGAASKEDAQRRIEQLNAEIFQLSALVTDRTVFAKRDSVHSDSFKKAYDSVEEWLGREMARRLTSATNAEDAIWVQMALQAIVARVAGRMIECWDITLESKQNELLTEIHNAILANEPLAVSLRWRALTRRYVRRQNEEDSLQKETDTILGLFQDVLLISGMKHDRPLPDWTGFRAQVHGLLRAILAVQRALGEESVASDFRVIHPPPSAPFAPDTMRDVDACDGDEPRSPAGAPAVLCTTELGLENYEEAQDAGLQRSVVLKAGVALQNSAAQT